VKEMPRRPSECSVTLLGPRRHHRKSSSYGIGCSSRVCHPLKYHRYCFDDPAVPLALASAVRFSFNGLLPATVWVTGRVLSSSFTFL
jgi:hypothetical protein